MLRRLFILLFVGLMLNAQGKAPVGPGDWSSVRLYGHSYNVNGFTDAEYDWIAEHNYMFCTEKRHARYVYGDPSSEYASQVASAQIKANNPITMPLFYWNASVPYVSIYETMVDTIPQHPEWISSNGEWNYTNPDFCNWWASVATDQINNYAHEGVFIDGVSGVSNAGTEEYLHAKMDELPGFKIYNGFWTTVGGRLLATHATLAHCDGVYVESFMHYTCTTPATGKQLLDNLLLIPDDKYIVGSYQADPEWSSIDHEFGMACYLIIANDNSFFRYALDGYDTDDLLAWHDDFGKTIGKPLAKAKVDGYVYTRTFEYVSVKVDLQNKTWAMNWVENPEYEPVLNLALLGTATQSSINHDGIASRANDGDTNGAYGQNSVTHTLSEDSPWWQVDFGASYSIGEISIFNRTDESAKARLSNFTVYVLDEDSMVTYSQSYTTYPDPSVTMDVGDVNGRYVVVQIDGWGALSLAEVQVAESTVSESKHVVSVKVIDGVTNDSIPLANFVVNGEAYTSNYLGEIALDLSENEYPYTLSKDGYETLNGTLNLIQDTAFTWQLTKTPTHDMSFKVNERGSYIGLSEVAISINEDLYSTNKVGEFSISLIDDLYDITLSKDGYQPIYLSVDLTKDTLLTIKMDRQQYSLGFKVVDANSLTAISSVAIDINDTVYISDALGMVSLDLAFGKFDYMISAMGYDNLNQSIDLVNDTMLVISMESTPSSINNTVSYKMVVSPNPTSNTFTLGIDIKEATLFDMSGKQVAHFINTQSQYDIYIS